MSCASCSGTPQKCSSNADHAIANQVVVQVFRAQAIGDCSERNILDEKKRNILLPRSSWLLSQCE